MPVQLVAPIESVYVPLGHGKNWPSEKKKPRGAVLFEAPSPVGRVKTVTATSARLSSHQIDVALKLTVRTRVSEAIQASEDSDHTWQLGTTAFENAPENCKP